MCVIHGITKHKTIGRNTNARLRCFKCACDAVQKRRKHLKIKAVEYLGGECKICSYSKCITALEFHHNNPLEKDFSISSDGSTRGWERIKPELDKCTLLCANCHREVHFNLLLENQLVTGSSPVF